MLLAVSPSSNQGTTSRSRALLSARSATIRPRPMWLPPKTGGLPRGRLSPSRRTSDPGASPSERRQGRRTRRAPDDPYRTLAWMVRKRDGFCRALMQQKEFAEFIWADWMRGKIEPAAQVAAGPKKFLETALKLAKSVRQACRDTSAINRPALPVPTTTTEPPARQYRRNSPARTLSRNGSGGLVGGAGACFGFTTAGAAASAAFFAASRAPSKLVSRLCT
jgi:hypothetical protein